MTNDKRYTKRLQQITLFATDTELRTVFAIINNSCASYKRQCKLYSVNISKIIIYIYEKKRNRFIRSCQLSFSLIRKCMDSSYQPTKAFPTKISLVRLKVNLNL